MQFMKFSRTGLTVSRLCLGTGTFGKQTDEAESFRVFDKASDAGLWLKGKRNRFLLGTKAGRPMGSSLGIEARLASTFLTRSTHSCGV